MTHRRPRIQPYVPPTTSGNLYYVRLKTPKGIFYKLGFTTLASVGERLAYKGTSDELLIDEVLLFMHDERAFFLEQQLHEFFSDSRAFDQFSSLADMPLFKNGQSELYARDVLELDYKFSEEQEKQTRASVRGVPTATLDREEALTKAFHTFYKLLLRPFLMLPLTVVIFVVGSLSRPKGKEGAGLVELLKYTWEADPLKREPKETPDEIQVLLHRLRRERRVAALRALGIDPAVVRQRSVTPQ